MTADRPAKSAIDCAVVFRWLPIAVPVAIVLFSIMLVLPAVQQAREAARRSQSRNNLKQIGLALHNYHDAYRLFPPGGVFNERGEGYHGWATQLLPYFDASPVYNWINFRLPWDAPENAGLFRPTHNLLENPSLARPADGRHFARADYSANSHLLAPNSSVGLSDVRNHNGTMIMGELGGDFVPWGCPFNWRPLRTLNDEPRTYGRPEGFGGHFLMVDGSVMWVAPDVAPDVLEALRGPDLAGSAYSGVPIRRPSSFPYPADPLDRSFKDLPGPGRFSAFLIKDSRGDVIRVSLHRGKGDTRRATDGDLAALSEFHELRELSANGDFTDAGMTALNQFRNLEVLRLTSRGVTDSGLRFLQQLPKLRHLSLQRPEVTTALAAILTDLPRLEELALTVDRRSEGLLKLEANLPPTVKFTLEATSGELKNE